ncbi:hypothetical protein NX059_011547 [Plenodomus lindquistii]|nr:hypothetical protein NX059_011547 [Plenodomus lindquistii]
MSTAISTDAMSNMVLILADLYANPTKTQKALGYTGQRNGEKTVSILNAINREEHAPRRKLLSHAFSTTALKQYEPLVYEISKRFCDSLIESTHKETRNGGWGATLDMGMISSYFTFDVMSNMVFYSPQDLLNKPDERHLVHGIEDIVFFTGLELEWPWLVPLRRFKDIFFRKQMKQVRAFDKSATAMVHSRLGLAQQKQEVNDVFGSLLKGGGPEDHGLSVPELVADAFVLVVAGTDTASTALSAFCFYLAKYPEAYARLASEIRTAFGCAEEIVPGPTLSGCTYLVACLDEAMRLSPPVAGPLWRTMRMKELVSNVIVPAGTDVCCCTYAIQRRPEYFPDPHEFRPERWLPEFTDEAQIKLAKSAFVPFSAGARGCLGKNVAYMEMTTAMAQLIYRMDWKLADGPAGKTGEEMAPDGKTVSFAVKCHFTSWKDGPFLQFKERDVAIT